MNRRLTRWILSAALLATFPLHSTVADARAKTAKSYFNDGKAAEAKDDPLAAYEAYSQAYQMDPSNLAFKTSFERVRFEAATIHVHRGEKLRDQGDLTGAVTEFLAATQIDPANELAAQDMRAARDKLNAPQGESSLGERSGDTNRALNEVTGPAELKPVSNEPITLHLVEDTKVVYQTIGKAAGINVLFDPDYTSKRIQVDLQNVSLLDALRIVGTVSDTFWRPVTANTIFVAQNTRAKRTELDEQAVQTFYLANAAQQNDLNDIQTALRNVLTNAKLYAVPSQNAIVMRATPDELLLAQKLINDLDKARPEVLVDVAILEVNRVRERNLGITLPQVFGAALQPNTNTTTPATTTPGNGTNSANGTGLGTTPTTPTQNGLTLNSFAHLNSNNFAITVGQATANLLYNDNDTRVLQNPRIRATDGQKANLKVGSRIPVATGSFQAGVGAAIASPLVNTQFQYLDVGVEIEITPTVHYDRDVSLKLKIVVSQTNGATNLGGVTEPIITQRTVDQVIRLKEGEVNIIGGILQRSLSNVLTGTPGLAQVPILKYLFSSTDKTDNKDEIVIMLTPHVVRATELSPLNLREIDTGTGNTVQIRRIATATVPLSALQGGTKSVPSTTAVPSGTQIPTPAQPTNAPATPGTPPSTSQTGGAVGLAPGTLESAIPGGAGTGTSPAGTPPSTATPISLTLNAPAVAPKTGSTFSVAVNVSGGQDVFSVPLQVQYDPAKLTLINVDAGNYLGKDGQAVALVHRDDGAGGVAVSASRPPGVAGITGAGQLAVLTFQAKAAGDSIVSVTKAAARNSQQQALPVVTSGTIVHVQ